MSGISSYISSYASGNTSNSSASNSSAILNDTYGITPSDWTLYDKIMYGGFGYTSFCMPSNILTVALAIIFPPLGMISAIISNYISPSAPWLTWDTIHILYNNLNIIIQSFLLTSFFYIPGLIYTMRYINKDPDDETAIDLTFVDDVSQYSNNE